jgi:hypothetical protein
LRFSRRAPPLFDRTSPCTKIEIRKAFQSFLSSSPPAKILASVFQNNMIGSRHPASMQRDGRAIVTRREAGMRWTRRPVRRTGSWRTQKSCGPGLPTLRPSSQRDERCERRGQESPVPEESTKERVKTTAQGMPDDPAEPVVPSPCFFYARWPWVRPSPGIPCALCHLEGQRDRIPRGCPPARMRRRALKAV